VGVTIPGAPLDLAHKLGDDWLQALLAFQTASPEAPLVEYLQAVGRSHGDLAIGLRLVHDLALFVSGPRLNRAGGFFPDLRETLGRINAAAEAPWPAHAPVDERLSQIPSKHLFELAGELEAILAEWYVLDALARKGARPVSNPPGARVFDWNVAYDDRILPVEVKQKESIGSVGDRLEWYWKGVSVIPAGRFIANYKWWWHIDKTCRAAAGRRAMDALWAGRLELETYLPVAIERAGDPYQCPFEWTLSSAPLSLRCAHFTSTPSLAIEFPDSAGVLIDVRPNPHPNVLACKGSDADYMRAELDDSDRDDLLKVLERLDASRQATRRKSSGLYVYVWWVPFSWEEVLSQDWLNDVCNLLADRTGSPLVAIWPIALFEARKLSWGLSSTARRELPWLA
jgi:hypothetical protein